ILKSLYDQDTILSKDIGDKMPVITDINDDNDVLPDNQPVPASPKITDFV
ncbi:3719_t:CDS:1, partial [Funneliformis mosseae]